MHLARIAACAGSRGTLFQQQDVLFQTILWAVCCILCALFFIKYQIIRQFGSDKKMSQKINLFTIMAAVFVVGCAPTPVVQSGPDAEMTFDGLTRVDGTIMSAVWVRAGAELDGYNKVMLEGAGVEYREASGPESGSSSTMRRSSQSEFPISEKDQERLEETVGAAFDSAMSESERFELVTEPGPGVLLIRGGLLDVVSNVPPEIVGRGEIFLSRVGEATLVIEIRDSQSKQIYVRAVDRRAAERAGQAVRASSVTTWAEVRRLANRWAGQLRNGVDALLEMENIPDQ